MKETVAVAMSGGVDSSLVAALLKERGYRVIGLTMVLTDESRGVEAAPGYEHVHGAVDDARLVADFLGIEHHVVDLKREFKAEVIDYFLGEYMKGRTPNPCVVCNRKIKMGRLFEAARNLGADYMATGHYARVEYDEVRGRHVIKKAADTRKDQSYALYRVNGDVLPHLLLPLGVMESKARTRAMAEERGLPVAHRPESQEVCFIPNDDYKSFLLKFHPEARRGGDIVYKDGTVLGHHDGVSFYTIGQRKGMGSAHPTPLYVTELDTARNRVVVGEADDVFATGLVASDMCWQSAEPPKLGERQSYSARIRYGKREAVATVERVDEASDKCRVTFDRPMRAVTPGQSVVLYDGDVLIGGGFIDEVIR